MPHSSSELFEVLQDLVILRILPVVLLKIVAAYACIGPIQGRLVSKFGTGGKWRGQFWGPSSIVCSEASEELLVLDLGNARVQVFSLIDLSFVREWGSKGSGLGQFHYPYCICVDKRTGHVIVSDWGNDRVQEFQLDGTFIRVIGNGSGSEPGQLRGPFGVSVDNEARLVYVSEFNNHRVSVFSLETGSFVRCFGSFGHGDDHMSSPRCIYFDDDRKLLLIVDGKNDRVKVVYPDGALARVFDDICFPEDVAVSAHGEVFITSWGSGLINTFCIADGQHLCNFGLEESEGRFKAPRGPTGICVDPCTGYVYVTDWNRHFVSIYE